MYELTLIFDSSLTNEQCDELVDKLGIVIDAKEVWGKRFLAYPIKKKEEGIYYFIQTHGIGGYMKELERKFNLESKILRYLFVVAPKKDE